MDTGSKRTGRKNKSPARGKAGRAARSPNALVKQGDIAPTLTTDDIRKFVVEQAMKGKQQAAAAAIEAIRHGPPELAPDSEPIKAILAGAAPDDAARLRSVLVENAEAGTGSPSAPDGIIRPAVPLRDHSQRHTSDELADDWRRGYPYKFKMLRRDYEDQKFVLQTELLKLQAWMKATHQRIILLFEGRDAAGKGGAIKRVMEHLNPRGARVVALEKPSEVERGQWYFQRYV
ncbi:MAG: hypothetical protein Q7J60_00910, partial [Bradyrhizobium sp.]|nr:hypothetical protein [Bradyrhizobium sp.]